MSARPGIAKRTLAAAALAALLWTAAAALVPGPAWASSASEEREGAQILGTVERGDRDCSDLSTAQFERIGEYAMGRMVGGGQAHERMDSLMKSMMGSEGLEQMHVIMGKRFAGCGGGRVPGSFGGMMGVMAMMGGSGNQGGAGTMMGGFGASYTGSTGDDDGFGAAGWVMVAMMAVLLALGAGVILIWRPRSGRATGSSPLDVLGKRYSRGEIDSEEYERSKRALEGSSS